MCRQVLKIPSSQLKSGNLLVPLALKHHGECCKILSIELFFKSDNLSLYVFIFFIKTPDLTNYILQIFHTQYTYSAMC